MRRRHAVTQALVAGLVPLTAAFLFVVAAPAAAVSITKTYVGTLSNPLTAFGDVPANNPGEVARGNTYVIRTTFNTDDGVAVAAAGRDFQSRDFWSIALDDAPGGGTNTFELFIPSEGFGGVLTQSGVDHFAITTGTAQSAEIHFFNPCSSSLTCAAEFRGFEFESNFIRANSPAAPDPTGDIIFELRDPDVNLSGTVVTNQVVNVLDGDPGFALQGIMFNGGTTDVRSESSGAAGGQQNPGVFLREAIPVVAEAGASPLVYSAGVLSVTTDAGTEQITEVAAPIVPGQLRAAPSTFDEQPRQADNDLGGGRSDGEDLLSFQWTAGGVGVAGNETGTRINRTVETLSPGGRSFVNDGTRIVDDVNITRSLAESGLQNTTDSVVFEVSVTESITGLSDTDTVTVSYANAGPSATAGPGVVFNAGNFMATLAATGSADDPDLVANAQVAGFETLTAQFSIGGINAGSAQNLGSPTAGPVPISHNVVTLQDAFNNGGLTMTTGVAVFDLEVTDFAGAAATADQKIVYDNTLPVIASAGHSVVSGLDILFEIDYDDVDLAVNPFLGVLDFESLVVEIFVDGIDWTGFFGGLIGTGGSAQLVDNADLMTNFGLGTHTFKLSVADKAMIADAVMPMMASFDFEVQPVPVPASFGLLMFGLGALGIRGRRRRAVGASLGRAREIPSTPMDSARGRR